MKKKEIEIKNKIENEIHDEERAFYNLQNTEVNNIKISGPLDGESAFKEAREIKINDSTLELRYPLWHTINFELNNSVLTEGVRAPLWYAKQGLINKTNILGVKCLRECKDMVLNDCEINSIEFGWRCSDVSITSSKITSEYFLFQADHINLDRVEMKGKYSFQYVNRGIITNSNLDTKDAFWHSKNLTVINSTIKGEYLGWYSENLTLLNCKISGTQPLCYCKNLRLVNCEMINCDLAFEYSDVNATILGHVDSIKNPRKGTIICESCGEVIRDHTVMKCNGKVGTTKPNE